MFDCDLLICMKVAEVLVDEETPAKVQELRMRALATLRGQVEYYRKLGYVERLIEGVAEKRAAMIMKTSTKTEMDKVKEGVLMLPYDNADKISRAKFHPEDATFVNAAAVYKYFHDFNSFASNVDCGLESLNEFFKQGRTAMSKEKVDCSFCAALANHKDNDEYYRNRRRNSDDYVYEYTAALVSQTYYEGYPTGKVTSYNYTLNYCPECGKSLMEAKYEPKDNNS